MPELPELQAHAERLTKGWGGNVLRKFTPLSFTAMKTAVPPPSEALDHALEGVGRRGKYLLLDFGALTFVVHLMQGGRLKPDPKQAAKAAGRRRPAGCSTIAARSCSPRPVMSDGPECGPILRCGQTAGLGPEADQVTPEELAKLFGEHSMRVHEFLRDQGCVAGLGRRLANEICHRAKISPFASTTKLGLDGRDGRRRRDPRVHRRVARLRAQPRRHELVSRPAGRGAPPHGPGVPGVRRHRARGLVLARTP